MENRLTRRPTPPRPPAGRASTPLRSAGSWPSSCWRTVTRPRRAPTRASTEHRRNSAGVGGVRVALPAFAEGGGARGERARVPPSSFGARAVKMHLRRRHLPRRRGRRPREYDSSYLSEQRRPTECAPSCTLSRVHRAALAGLRRDRDPRAEPRTPGRAVPCTCIRSGRGNVASAKWPSSVGGLAVRPRWLHGLRSSRELQGFRRRVERVGRGKSLGPGLRTQAACGPPGASPSEACASLRSHRKLRPASSSSRRTAVRFVVGIRACQVAGWDSVPRRDDQRAPTRRTCGSPAECLSAPLASGPLPPAARGVA